MFYSGNILRRKNIRECVEKLRPRCWPEETTICYKISLVQWLITDLNVILYLSTYHTIYISVLIIFMIMPSLIINTYVSLMYELKKNGKVFTSKSVGTGPSSYEKRIYRAAVSQMLRNTDITYTPDTYPAYPHLNSNLQQTKKETTNVSWAPDDGHSSARNILSL